MAKAKLQIRTADGCTINSNAPEMPEANALALYQFWSSGCDPKLLKKPRKQK